MSNYYTQAVCSPTMLPLNSHVRAMFKFLKAGEYPALVAAYGSNEAACAAAVEFAKSHFGGSATADAMTYFLQHTDLNELDDVDIAAIFDDRLNLDWEREDTVEIDGQSYVNAYLYAATNLGDIDASFLQWAIKQMPSKIRWISVEFAHTCSKMIPDGFGGGAWFITRSGLEVIHTTSWVEEQIAMFKEREKGLLPLQEMLEEGARQDLDAVVMNDITSHLNEEDQNKDGINGNG